MQRKNRWCSHAGLAIALSILLAACGYRASFTPPGQPKPTPQVKIQPTLTTIEALEFAFFKKDFAQAKQLLKSVSVQEIERSELMLRAVQNNQPELIQLMLQRGVNPNTNDGISPLRQAVRSGNDPLVRLLLQHGADPNHQDGNTDSILQEALFGNSYIGFLHFTSRIEQFPQVSPQSLETIRLILKAGANPNDRDRGNGTTVLMVAAGHGNKELVELLLQQGANAKAANAYGQNALHYAAWRGNSAIVQRLLSQKVSVNTPKSYLGRTPLIFAVRRGSLPIVKLLLAHGANVNAASRETSVDTGRVRYSYQSVLDHAIAANHPAVIALLKQRGAKPYPQK